MAIDPGLVTLGIKLLELVIEKGGPLLIKFSDGTTIENPTAADLDALKVKKMSEKVEESNDE